MINLSTDARLSIILPNTNKALAEALQHATPEQLDQLNENKDIKSLLTSVFQDKITSSKSDQVLLDILKNGAAFKNMGNAADELKALLSGLKSSPDLSLKSSAVEGFFKNFGSLDTATLKNQILNSGVFMESKIGAAVQTLPNLQKTLESLRLLLSKSTLSETKLLNAKIGSLLESPILNSASHDLKSADQLSAALKNITDTLRTLIGKSDLLYSKEITPFVSKIDQFSLNQSAQGDIKTTLSQLYGALLSSNAADSNALLDSIELLLKELNSTADPLPKLKELSHLLNTTIASGDVVLSKEVAQLVSKLEEFSRPEALLIDELLQESMGEDLKSGLMTLAQELRSSADPSAAALLDHVDKLLTLIDYHQLLSHLSNSNSIYFPFVWDQLEEGSMAFKKTKEKKFYCEIHLRLKEYGELDLMLGLYDTHQLELQAHTQNPELKQLIQENIPELRTLLINAGLTPRRIRIFEMKESALALNESYASDDFGSDLGFEVTV